jgi:hypothetical protein
MSIRLQLLRNSNLLPEERPRAYDESKQLLALAVPPFDLSIAKT